MECRNGTCHIPKDSNDFPSDKSGHRTSVNCGGSVPVCTGRSLGTKTLSAHPTPIHANALEDQVGDGCSKIPCPSPTGGGHSQLTSILRDGTSHIPRESRPTRKNAWTTPHIAAASSMHCDPRNTSCAEDRASKVSFLMDKSAGGGVGWSWWSLARVLGPHW